MQNMRDDDGLDVFLAALLAGQALQNLVRRAFDEAGVPIGAWGLLAHVDAHGMATPSQLAAETGVTATTIRDQVQTLVQRGALERRPNPADSRSYLLALTHTGREELERGRQASAAAERALAAELEVPVDEARRLLLHLRDAARMTELRSRSSI
jgi:DNA-binding MarR family transcriptional regulator